MPKYPEPPPMPQWKRDWLGMMAQSIETQRQRVEMPPILPADPELREQTWKIIEDMGRKIKDMAIGSVGYTVPWALSYYKGHAYLHVGYVYLDFSVGTATLRVERHIDGWWIDTAGCDEAWRDEKWNPAESPGYLRVSIL